jgi:hypothetical protein
MVVKVFRGLRRVYTQNQQLGGDPSAYKCLGEGSKNPDTLQRRKDQTKRRTRHKGQVSSGRTKNNNQQGERSQRGRDACGFFSRLMSALCRSLRAKEPKRPRIFWSRCLAGLWIIVLGLVAVEES